MALFGFGRHKDSNKDQQVKPPILMSQQGNKSGGGQRFEFNGSILEGYKLYKADSIIKQQVQMYTELCLNSGFQIVSSDKTLQQKIELRIKEIEFNTGSTMEFIVRQLLKDFIQTGNQFAIYARDKGFTTGKSYKYDNKQLDPIQGIFPVPSVMMSISRDSKGTVTNYSQDFAQLQRSSSLSMQWNEQNVSASGGKAFKQTDVLHIQYDYDLFTGFGRPFFFEQIDDVLMLRRLEILMDDIISSGQLFEAMYKIGDANSPVVSQQEILDAKQILEATSPYGIIVAPGNHSLEVKSTNLLQDIILLYDRMRHRVFGALGISSVMFGESGSANRQTANESTETMYMRARDFQRTFAQQINSNLLVHLVMDAGYDPLKLGNQMPIFMFNEPDVDLLIKKQNNAVYLYEHSQITETEMRKMLNMNPVPDAERQDMYVNRVQQQKFGMQQSQQQSQQPSNENPKNNNPTGKNQMPK